jgi:hypothetical protein
MEAKELRISNLVHLIADGHENEPDLLIWELEDYEFYENKMEYIKPIPLTEEWLLKFGFYKTTENAGNLICYKKGKYTIAKWLKNKWQFWINTTDLYNSPQYVHQLQNLFFCLCGEELMLKDN